MRRKLFKANLIGPRYTPKVESPLIHREPIVVYVPRPKGNACSFDREPELLFSPDRRQLLDCWQTPIPHLQATAVPALPTRRKTVELKTSIAGARANRGATTGYLAPDSSINVKMLRENFREYNSPL